jgi:uncharacterized phage protein (TIGR02220 family)
MVYAMSNLYIRVKTAFYTHRKTVRLRLSIGTDAYWIPPRLWAYAAENQPDGDLSAYSSEELAELLGCSKYASSILQALKNAGFVDESGKIHDWNEHNGYHDKFSIRAKKAADARWGKEERTKEEGKGKRKEERGDKHCISDATSISREGETTALEFESKLALSYLNQKTGRNFRETETNMKFIQERMKESGVTLPGVRMMIDRQCENWKGTKMEEYLRPETLFNKTKFDGYYAARELPVAVETPEPSPAQKISLLMDEMRACEATIREMGKLGDYPKDSKPWLKLKTAMDRAAELRPKLGRKV